MEHWRPLAQMFAWGGEWHLAGTRDSTQVPRCRSLRGRGLLADPSSRACPGSCPSGEASGWGDGWVAGLMLWLGQCNDAGCIGADPRTWGICLGACMRASPALCPWLEMYRDAVGGTRSFDKNHNRDAR